MTRVNLMVSKINNIEKVSFKRRQEALNNFGDLLNSDTKESDWQRLFDDNPFIFSETLSVKFDGLFNQVPLASGIPDYVFVRNNGFESSSGIVRLILTLKNCYFSEF
ncbi:MAG: hypothetical protein AB2563_06305 [Candidatus Thiodiazotropha endolucinida]